MKWIFYSFQVQGQLMVTGAPWCDFVVYTGNEEQQLHVERIYPDQKFMDELFQKLCNFYDTHARPYLIKENIVVE